MLLSSWATMPSCTERTLIAQIHYIKSSAPKPEIIKKILQKIHLSYEAEGLI
jgi:hypothetical protein